jgi:integrase
MSTDSPHGGRDSDLIPLAWDSALEKHADIQRANNRRRATIESHQYRLSLFIEWLTPKALLEPEEDEGPRICKTTELKRHHIQDYKLKRSNEVAKTTLKTQMDTIRVFFRNLESYGALPDGMHQFAESPNLEDGEGQRSQHLPTERGNQIRDHLRKYAWASERHIFHEVIWSTGMRIGAAHGIDVDDIDFDENLIRLRHRPDQGTTLKNGKVGERTVTIHGTVVDAIEDFLERPDRPDNVEDEYGRTPLFCNEDGTGRRHKQYLRDLCYSVTRPCMTEDGCPYEDRDPNTCSAAQSKSKAYGCPASMAPHALRSGALTRMMENDIPPWAISRRVDCSEKVLEEHYVELDEDEKAEVLRDYFEDDYQ